MKPDHIKKMQKMFNIPNDAVIQVRIPEGMPRVCDYCNDDLVDGKGIVVKHCHLTDYGLVCNDCLGKSKPIESYKVYESVYLKNWYQDGIERRDMKYKCCFCGKKFNSPLERANHINNPKTECYIKGIKLMLNKNIIKKRGEKK